MFVCLNSVLCIIMLVIGSWYENQFVLKTKYIYNVYFQYPFTLIGIIHVIKWFAVQIMGPTCSLTWRAYNVSVLKYYNCRHHLYIHCIYDIYYMIIRDYYMTVSILALVSARDSHIKLESEPVGLDMRVSG